MYSTLTKKIKDGKLENMLKNDSQNILLVEIWGIYYNWESRVLKHEWDYFQTNVSWNNSCVSIVRRLPFLKDVESSHPEV